MTLSVVILNYNVQYFLEHCLYSVVKATSGMDAEIIVVDNASVDGSVAMVREKFPQVKLIASPNNDGFSAGNNLGIAETKGQYVCLLNPDTILGEQTLRKALEKAQSIENLGALGIKMIDGTGSFLPESKRKLPLISAALKKVIGLGGGRGYYQNDIDEDGEGSVGVLVGAFMLFLKERYYEVGGLDETYFMYGEDIDLSYSFTKAGYVNYYYGGTSMIHYKGESTAKDKAYWDRFYGAMEIFYKKHFPSSALVEGLLKAGLWILKHIAAWSHRTKKPKVLPVKQRYLLSEQFALREKLEGLPEFENLSSLSKSRAFDGAIMQSLLVMDTSYMDYQQIIRLMQELKNSGNRFRIHPKRTNFIIGSDYSDQKGEVVQW
ncbi:glycosyltransferase family 2 protein [Gilvibacter sediminis]|uniref:glycosyltransferase family 2 protein n=1 Tax=Gilvibacter sediminis TaxID=379071 RepID=UPI002350688F|nr:glycosyltransferase family 2 protein [Gilvibacter sediminis]MDC7998808.1 glycosyltransferase family 2 protein [Gilvibacter sediminis]